MKARIPSLDLHMHTTVSDGTDTPEALLAHVKAAGIGLFSVTDHPAIPDACIIVCFSPAPADSLYLFNLISNLQKAH